MVALLGGLRRFDLVVVIDQVGIPLAGVAAQEAVETFEAAGQWPAGVGPCARLLVARGQMPLAHHEGVVALLEEHLGEETVLERDDSVVAGIARRELGDGRHGVAVVVASGDDARAARRTQRRRVHVVVAEPISRERVEVRCRDRASEAAELTVPGVVQHDGQDIGGTRLRPYRGRPRRARLVGGATDDAGERGPGLVLHNSHDNLHIVQTRALRALSPRTTPASPAAGEDLRGWTPSGPSAIREFSNMGAGPLLIAGGSGRQALIARVELVVGLGSASFSGRRHPARVSRGQQPGAILLRPPPLDRSGSWWSPW